MMYYIELWRYILAGIGTCGVVALFMIRHHYKSRRKRDKELGTWSRTRGYDK